jgi:hypothetical protein
VAFGYQQPADGGENGGTRSTGRDRRAGARLDCRATKTWGSAPAQPLLDALDITARNIAHVTIDAARARVDCAAQLKVTSDGPLKVTLADCPGTSGIKTFTFAG